MSASFSFEWKRHFAERAASLGLGSAEEYLRVVFGAVPRETASPLSDEEFSQILSELSSNADLPTLPANFSRADIYADHD